MARNYHGQTKRAVLLLYRRSAVEEDSGETKSMIQAATCPCHIFRSLESIESALRFDEDSRANKSKSNGENLTEHPLSTRNLVNWLSSGWSSTASSSCRSDGGSGGGCSQRGKTSLTILNAIREACRPFLEDNDRKTLKVTIAAVPPHNDRPRTTNKQPSSASEPSYDEAFPALSSSSAASNAPAAPLNARKAKRRIRPATVGSIAAPGSSAAATLPKGNLVNAPALTEPSLEGVEAAWSSHTKNVYHMSTSSHKEQLTTPTKTKEPGLNTASPKQKNRSPQRKSKIVAQECLENVAKVHEVQNLMLLYCTLIESFLVPSTAQELQLLLQLLTVGSMKSAATTPGPEDDVKVYFSSILSSPARCQHFAARSLERLKPIIIGLYGSTVVLPELFQCPPVRLYCPELTTALELAWQQHRTSHPDMDWAAATNHPSLTTNRAAFYTLPFNAARDSRHHYKTLDEQALYKNREEARDGFLTQLRTFLGLRGNVTAREQTDHQMGRFKQASSQVIANLSDANLGWFAEFFCEMLLQIGLVPLEETDADLLKMANQDKLQKLHQRITSNNNQRVKRGTRNLIDDAKLELSSPELEAQQLFPGHQAFFFAFLRAVDSHRLVCHLQTKLASTLCHRSKSIKTEDMERHLLELCLLARFLGVLVFAPNWQSDSQKRHNVESGYCGLTQLTAVGVSPTVLILEAWDTYRLVAVVPWIVDMLKLAKRDVVTKNSQALHAIVELLRELQAALWSTSDNDTVCAAVAVVKLSLETFLGEVVGISRLQAPKRPNGFNTRSPMNAKGALDDAFRGVSRPMLFYFNSHLEPLVDLLATLSRADLGLVKSPGASRKLRPLPLAPSPVSITSPTNRSADDGTQVSLRAPLLGHKNDSIQAKLRDAFFHQHADLKDICELVGGRALKAAMSKVSIEWPGGVSSTEKSFERYVAAVATQLRRCLRQSLELLLVSSPPPSVRVVEMAVSLTCDQLLKLSDTALRAAAAKLCGSTAVPVSTNSAPARQLFTESPALSAVQLPPAATTTPPKDHLSALTLAIQGLTTILNQGSVADNLKMLLDGVIAVRHLLNQIRDEDDKRIPSDAALRSLFQAILDLDDRSESVLDKLLLVPLLVSEGTADPPQQQPQQQQLRWSVLVAFLRLALELGVVSTRGLWHVRSQMGHPAMVERLVRMEAAAMANTTKTTDASSSLVSDLLEAQWIPVGALPRTE